MRSDLIASNLGLKVSDAQQVLETTDHLARLDAVNEILSAEIEVLQMQAKIRSTAKMKCLSPSASIFCASR